jgi:hypothetical protein
MPTLTPTDVKNAFVEALNDTPDGIKSFLEVPLPSLAGIGVPSTVDEAIIAEGTLAANLNTILTAFVGLTPVELLLRIGQHNVVIQSMLLAAIQYIGNVGEMTIEAPKSSGKYFGYFSDFVVSFTGGDPVSVSCALDANDKFDMVKQAGKWVALWAVAVGSHVLTVTAHYAVRDVVQTVTFDVLSYRDIVTIPEIDQQYQGGLPSLSATTLDSTDALSRVVFTCEGQACDLSQGQGLWAAPGLISLPQGVYSGVFNFIKKVSGEVFSKTLEFVVGAI